MTKGSAAAIYARISQDREGTGQGIERQVRDCQRLASELGWTVAQVYVDDDISAYSGKRRPAYEQMLDDIGAGMRDAVLVWHMDRLHRQPRDLERFADTCEAAGVRDLRTVHGAVDLGTGDGMLVARLMAAVAANESDAKRRRGRRKMLEIAESGKPHMGGGMRPFGFEPDRTTHRPTEAETLRALADRALAGQSLTSMCRWLGEQGVTTTTGKPWRSQVLRGVLLNPRYYGVRVYRGQPFGPATWDPIITPEQGEALRHLLTDPARRTNRTARRYLLSGLCRCHHCGTVMYSVPRYDTRRYLCRSGNDFGGCGRMAIYAEGAEGIVAEAVLQRLDSPDLHDALEGRNRDDTRATALRKQIAADNDQLEELRQLYTDRQITGPEWIKTRKDIEHRRSTAQHELSGLSGTRSIDAYIGNSATLRETWQGLNLDAQVAIVKALIEHVEILPGVSGRRGVSVDRIRPVWRV